MSGSWVHWVVLAGLCGGCAEDDGGRELGERPRVVYGDEDRVEAREMPSSALRGTHYSVAMMSHWSFFECDGDDRDDCSMATVPVDAGLGGPMCHWEPFHGQESAGFCTAFLVGDDLLMTAGHCVDVFDCEDVAFVFDYQMEQDGTARTEHMDVYGCEEIVFAQDDDEADIALVRIDRSPPGSPLCIARDDAPDADTRLASVSHPMGLPKKSADGGVSGDVNGQFFDTTLDTGPGSSGAPVFDRGTMSVWGVHAHGVTPTYEFDAFNQCMYSVECDEDDGCSGVFAEATSTRVVEHLVPEVECYAGASPHQNPGNKYDVNDDGDVTSADRMVVGDILDALGHGSHFWGLDHRDKPPYLDVSGDNWLSHQDYEGVGAKLGIPNVEPGACGDFNGDGVAITSSDFVVIFQQYEVQQSGHVDGDCNGDSRLGSTDWVIAFQSGLPYVG